MKLYILKKKRVCYLSGKQNNLTYHHLIPQKDEVNDLPENIMVLNREIHDIIDLPQHLRRKKVYLKHKEIIDKYNSYLFKHNFPQRLLWKFKGIKNYSHNKNKNSINKFKIKKKMINKNFRNSEDKKNNLTPFQKRKLNSDDKDKIKIKGVYNL